MKEKIKKNVALIILIILVGLLVLPFSTFSQGRSLLGGPSLPKESGIHLSDLILLFIILGITGFVIWKIISNIKKGLSLVPLISIITIILIIILLIKGVSLTTIIGIAICWGIAIYSLIKSKEKKTIYARKN